eukprot:4330477-Pleurochrysis_carterae.AAC.1
MPPIERPRAEGAGLPLFGLPHLERSDFALPNGQPVPSAALCGEGVESAEKRGDRLCLSLKSESDVPGGNGIGGGA